MEILEEPIVIPFQTILNFSTLVQHPKQEFIIHLIESYTCFQDKVDTPHRWVSAKKHKSILPVLKERPKIGIQDSSIAATIKKELQSLLNKLTETNFQTILVKVIQLFDMTYVSIFIDIIWSYLQRQPDFQVLYIQMIEKIYEKLSEDSYIEIGIVWNGIWRKYLSVKEWKLNKELVETSHNYNDFCDYVKEKKRSISTIQAWARLINLGIVSADPYELMYDILYHMVKELNIESKIDGTCLECYVEQVTEYYKGLSKEIQSRMPNTLDSLFQDIKEMNVNKSCQFKIEALMKLVLKNDIGIKIKKNLSIYELEDHEF